MKAWIVGVSHEPYNAVVFAETRGKAKTIALTTDTFYDCDFCDLEVHRMPQMDKYYVNDKLEMEWDNLQDRIALVKDGGFRCIEYSDDDCLDCPANRYCDRYEE